MNQELKKILEKVNAIIISSPSNIIYLTKFSGFSETERECFLLITKNKNFLITDRRYSEAVEKITKNFTVIDTGVGMFLKKEAKELFKKLNLKTLGFEENDLKVIEYRSLKKITKLKPIDLSQIKIIKNEDEIKNIKLACEIADQAFNEVIKKIKLGITEKEISNLIESFIKEKNADISFKPIVAFGKNSSVPHHQTGESKLKKNQIILLDFGVKKNNYCSDMSRTIYFGKAPDKFIKIHNTVLLAQKRAISEIRVGVKASKIDNSARNFILDAGFPNIIHSVGHGIGIDVHETPFISPNSKDTIQEGMVFSVEPGIYIPNYGGVRIEDLVLVRADNVELISHSNREIIEL